MDVLYAYPEEVFILVPRPACPARLLPSGSAAVPGHAASGFGKDSAGGMAGSGPRGCCGLGKSMIAASDVG